MAKLKHFSEFNHQRLYFLTYDVQNLRGMRQFFIAISIYTYSKVTIFALSTAFKLLF